MTRREIRNAKPESPLVKIQNENARHLLEYVKKFLQEVTENKNPWDASIQVDQPRPMYLLGCPTEFFTKGPKEVLIRFKYVE